MRFLLLLLFLILPVSTLQATPIDGLEYRHEGNWVAFDPEIFANIRQPLCVRHKNFWCLKQPVSGSWRGSVGQDSKSHAIFNDTAYGARAFFIVMRSYRFRHSIKSVRGIFSRYAPSADCVGSLPKDPETGQCPVPYGPNKPYLYAQRVAASLSVGIDEDLKLFSSSRVLDCEKAIILGKAVAQFELGNDWRVTEAILKRGIALSGIESDCAV